MRLKFAIAALVAIGCGAGVQARAESKEATDSVSAAFATVWGSYIHDMLDQRYPADAAAFSRFADGVAAAFDIPPVDEPYYQGVLQGFTVIERLANMRELGFPLSKEAFIEVFKTVLAGGSTGFTPESADTFLNGYLSRQYEAQMAADTLSVASQREFLDREAAREGVIKTPDGLLFEVLTEGEGQGPTLDDSVAITYTGCLYNGIVFDEADTPAVLPIKGLVPGFSEGLLMMKPGGTYRLLIPAELGYGPKGTAGVIPGNAALDFTITLHDIIKQ